MKDKLSYKIENLYVNSKLNIDIELTISNIYKKICNIVICLLKKYEIKVNINQHGSYALNTIILQKNGEIDLDIGLLINLNDVKMYQLCNLFVELKKKIIDNLKKKLKTKYEIKNITEGKCAFTIKINNFHIDIAMYLESNNKQYLFYENNKFILDNKHMQYDILKKSLSNNDDLKQFICFVKYIYKNIDYKIYKKYINSKISSIAITEAFVLIYNDDIKSKEIYDIGYQLIYYLITIYNKLLNNFKILNSGNKEENLINNHKRKLNYNNTLDLLDIIIDELIYLYENDKICDGILKNILKNHKILKSQKYYHNNIDKSDFLDIETSNKKSHCKE